MDPIAPLIARFHAEGRPRIWSLVITIMGDVVQPRGGHIDLARLREVTGRIGIEPGALRTALSRLVADGWLERERNGRSSGYRLGPSGRAGYEPAAARIYAAPAALPEKWTIAHLPDGTEGVALGGGMRLVPGAAPDRAQIAVEGTLRITDAARSMLCPPDHATAFKALFADLDAVEGVKLQPLDAMAARVLLVHRWRRIVLRFPELPDNVLPPEATDPRGRFARAYRALLPGSEQWLDAGGGLPAADATLASRFA